MKAEIK